METPFNATFFATVAVIIPVLFLALALQSDYLARTFVASRHIDRISKDQLKAGRIEKNRVKRLASLVPFYVSLLVGLAGVLVFVYAVEGEILCLLALEQRQASLKTQSAAMEAAVILTLAAAVASLWRIVEAYVKAERQATRKRTPIESQSEGATSPDAPSSQR